MPRMDGTGPEGFGPMTGGGRGVCATGAGRGRGGRGWRHEYHATGLTGWQRAARANPHVAATRRDETLERIEASLSEIVQRLEWLEDPKAK